MHSVSHIVAKIILVPLLCLYASYSCASAQTADQYKKMIRSEERQALLSGAVLTAILDDNTEILRRLAKSGFKLNEKLILPENIVEELRMDYALHLAARLGSDKCVAMLLKLGADRFARDSSNKLAAHYVSREECAKLLATPAGNSYCSALAELLVNFKIGRALADYGSHPFKHCTKKDLEKLGIFDITGANEEAGNNNTEKPGVLSVELLLEMKQLHLPTHFKVGITNGPLSGKFLEGTLRCRYGVWFVDIQKFGNS